jgi:choline dehydrogenase-like flavoprotein
MMPLLWDQARAAVWLATYWPMPALKVLMLEAGPFFDPAKDSQQLKWSYESPRRGAGTTRPFGDFDAAFGGWELEGEPYTTKDNTEFSWFRSRMLGGRTNHWGRISLRMGPLILNHAKDGLTDDVANNLRRSKTLLRQG